MVITVRFAGALRHAAGVGELILDYEGGVSIRELVTELIRKLPALTRGLIDQQLEDPKPIALILVNGREISVLNGLDTSVRDGSEVVLVSVVHGG